MTVPDSQLPPAQQSLVREAVNAIRALSFHAVEKANSGHPGLPMGAADMAYVLWTKFLKHDPSAPQWPNRDRFVLSAGHGSMLLYSLLHLTGYADMTLEEIQNFRQWGARTAGHPEYGHASGIETTTGPLGQGVGNAVGMALAAAMLAERVNTTDAKLVDHRIFCLCSDGDLMEGVSAEACSLAGHLQLPGLVLLYDDNGISIDGSTELSFNGEDVAARFRAYGWFAQHIDGHDHAAIAQAIQGALDQPKPAIICARTLIGFGAPNKQGSEKVHGSPLGAKEIEATRERLGWTYPPFVVPQAVYDHYRQSTERGRKAHAAWKETLTKRPEAAAKLRTFLDRQMPADLAAVLPAPAVGKGIATRKSSEAVIQALAPRVPSLVGGSADLTGSTNTYIAGSPAVNRGQFVGRNIHWGVREHGMASVMNGMALHGGFIPYGATFLVFTDYCRPSIRLAALMGQQVIHVMTHDSVFLGEDGPTHQPVEHLEALRVIPRLNVMRPDPSETGLAWVAALQHRNGPTVLVLSRQNIPTLANPGAPQGVARGGYIMREGKGGASKLDLVILATGSELPLAVSAAEVLETEGRSVRVVSMVSEYFFRQQDAAYRASVLPAGVPRLAVEAGCTRGWRTWVGDGGSVVGIDDFGHSAPAERLAVELGFTVENVSAQGRSLIGK